ncbi:hypothetical protein ACLOJK_024532 [Asimina triloba]
MGDWLEIAQCLFIGLVCSFLVSKLISSVTSFSEENPSPAQELPPAESSEEPSKKSSSPVITDEPEKRSAEKSTASGGLSGDDDDDDDWEGVESTELDEKFSAATAFVAATAADRRSQKVPNELRLQLYGLYKIATEGPCSTPQPSAIKISARAKWYGSENIPLVESERVDSPRSLIIELLSTVLLKSASS